MQYTRNGDADVYFINWQRDISVEERAGRKVVVKRDKPTKGFHEYLLLSTYTIISLILAHPSAPPCDIARNEGPEMRSKLERAGIPTPRLVSIEGKELIEEYIEGGDLYRALVSGVSPAFGQEVGRLTALAHSAGIVFTDNKAQNFLVQGNSLLRTDLAFIQISNSTFARSMDVGSFLASVVDLQNYREIEQAFYTGYRLQSGKKLPCLTLAIRNILSLGFSSNGKIALHNMMLDSSELIGCY
jgi:tRNA A-37 threonylcarbamoyl transferase component Bud32